MRRPSGNMLVFVTAVFMALVVPILMFCLWYVRTLGSHSEQRSATEAAALAAADSMSRLVIDDPNFGFVGVSDYAPVAPNTKAPDGQNLPVKGINTLLATVRVDMIIADQMNDTVMKQLAARDYTNAIKAKDFLVQSMQDAATKNPSADYRDVDSNPVRPYNAALVAYRNNIVRMTGTPNAVNANTFKLTLGCLATPGNTNSPVPQPSTYANVDGAGSTTQNGATTYKSYVNIPYKGNAFVFAGCDNNTRLIDAKTFTANLDSLPYVIPTIIRVDADHFFAAGRGDPNSSMIHSVACAQPGSACDPRPSPGALKLDFPDGVPPEVARPGDLLTSPVLSTNPTQFKSPPTGDYPPSNLLPVSGGSLPSFVPLNPPPNYVSGAMIYDWIKRAGTKANIKSILDFKEQALSPKPQTIAYEWDTTGNIIFKVLPATPVGYVVPASQNQLYAETINPIKSKNGSSYDFTASDAVAVPGKLSGGKHGGEPLVDTMLTFAPEPRVNGNHSNILDTVYGANLIGLLVLCFCRGKRKLKSLSVASFSVLSLAACGGGPAPSNIALTTNITGPRVPRDTYLKNGMAVEIELKLHK